jgi:hypothetical protein
MQDERILVIGVFVFCVVVPSIIAISKYVRMHKIPKKDNSSD